MFFENWGFHLENQGENLFVFGRTMVRQKEILELRLTQKPEQNKGWQISGLIRNFTSEQGIWG